MPENSEMPEPWSDEKELVHAHLEDLGQRAQEVSKRLVSFGIVSQVQMKRGPGNHLELTLQMGADYQIALAEMLADHLEARQQG